MQAVIGLSIALIGKVADTLYTKKKSNTIHLVFIWICFIVGFGLMVIGGLEILANENKATMELWSSAEYVPIVEQINIMLNAKKELQTLMGDDTLKREFVQENMRVICR